MPDRPYTPKQMGDACEMLVAAEMTLAGIPALKVPDGWPHYDVIAQPQGEAQPQRVSVKSRTFKNKSDDYVSYDVNDQFDWLAIVQLPGDGQLTRRIFIIPKTVADARARKDRPTSATAHIRQFTQKEVATKLGEFENNFCLSPTGKVKCEPAGKV